MFFFLGSSDANEVEGKIAMQMQSGSRCGAIETGWGRNSQHRRVTGEKSNGRQMRSYPRDVMIIWVWVKKEKDFFLFKKKNQKKSEARQCYQFEARKWSWLAGLNCSDWIRLDRWAAWSGPGCKSSLAVRITQSPGAPINLGQAAPAENPKGANSAVRKREAGVGGMSLLSEEAADSRRTDWLGMNRKA